MKNYKINLLFIILFLFFNSSYSQEKTLYEKKVEDLTWQFYKDLGINQSDIDHAKKTNNTENLNVLVKKLVTTNAGIEKYTYSMMALNNELKKAEALKTEFELKKTDIIKNKNKELEDFKQSDYSTISKNIKTDFEKWLIKNEFEKESVFVERLTSKGQKVFDSICYFSIQNLIREKSKDSKNLELEIGKYDAEKEYFNIKIKLFNAELEDTLNVEYSLAEKFKNNQYSENYVAIPKGNSNWYFSNNNIFPKELIFSINDKKYSKNIQNHLQNIKPLNFTTKSLDIDNNLDLSFDYVKYQKEVESNRLLYPSELDVAPYFQGGIEKFGKYFYKSYHKITENRDFQILPVFFIIENDGSITSVQAPYYAKNEIKEAIKKVMEASPKWIPGELKGVKVRCGYKINFNLPGEGF